MPQCAVFQLLVIQLDFVYHVCEVMCVRVCVGCFIIYNEHTLTHNQTWSRQRGNTTGAEALDTNYATRKK